MTQFTSSLAAVFAENKIRVWMELSLQAVQEGQEALKWSRPCFSPGKVYSSQVTQSRRHGDERVLLPLIEPEAYK